MKKIYKMRIHKENFKINNKKLKKKKWFENKNLDQMCVL